jgi:hypothetical protein
MLITIYKAMVRCGDALTTLHDDAPRSVFYVSHVSVGVPLCPSLAPAA